MAHGFAQTAKANLWEVFEKVKFREIFYQEFEDVLPTPQFDEAIRKWEGKVITLNGYVIPATEAPGFEWIILSRFSFANCFFCGKAGVESIAEVQLKGKRPRFKNDEKYTFSGRLKLNKNDWKLSRIFLLLGQLFFVALADHRKKVMLGYSPI